LRTNKANRAPTIVRSSPKAFSNAIVTVFACTELKIAVIIFGGIKSISRITEMIVPPMAIVYIGVAIFVVGGTIISVIREMLLMPPKIITATNKANRAPTIVRSSPKAGWASGFHFLLQLRTD
jgi:Na+/alanine symporter